MPSHKFEYVISGVELTEDQKTAVSTAIAAAVSETLIGRANELLKGKVWNILNGPYPPPMDRISKADKRFHIYGGFLAVAADHENIMQQVNKNIQRMKAIEQPLK